MVQTVDVLSSSWDVAEDVLKVKDGSTMLAFFNIAVDASILNPADDCRERLNRVLVALHTALHPKGTLAIALETTSSLDFPYMEGEPLARRYNTAATLRGGSACFETQDDDRCGPRPT